MNTLAKRSIESRKQRRRDCEFTFKGIPTEVLEQKVMVISRPTLEMVEILRRRGQEMINGKIVPLSDEEARK